MVDVVDLHSTGQVLHANETGKEVMKQHLSLLLACLRVRADAIQQSATELVTGEDLDHLEIVKVLSSSMSLTAADDIHRMALIIQQSYVLGTNKMKFRGKELPSDLMTLIEYSIMGRLKVVMKQIPMFAVDIQEGGPQLQQVMQAIIKALAVKQRLAMELRERAMRKSNE